MLLQNLLKKRKRKENNDDAICKKNLAFLLFLWLKLICEEENEEAKMEGEEEICEDENKELNIWSCSH